MLMTQKNNRSKRTLADLRHAARVLATTRPIDQISAEDIAAAAGVSRRTFFNYFPTTSEAFLLNIGNDPDLLERLAQGEPDHLADCLADVITARAQVLAQLCEEYPGYFEAIVAAPHMRELLLHERYRLDANLRYALARRFHCDEDDSLINVLSHLAFIIEHEILHKIPAAEAATAQTNRKTRNLTHALARALTTNTIRETL